MRYIIRSTMDAYQIVQMHTQLLQEAKSRGWDALDPQIHIEGGKLCMETRPMQIIAPVTLRNWKDYLTEEMMA